MYYMLGICICPFTKLSLTHTYSEFPDVHVCNIHSVESTQNKLSYNKVNEMEFLRIYHTESKGNISSFVRYDHVILKLMTTFFLINMIVYS